MKKSKSNAKLSNVPGNRCVGNAPSSTGNDNAPKTLLDRWNAWWHNRLIAVVVLSIGAVVAAAGEFAKHLEDLRPAFMELRQALDKGFPWERERDVTGQVLRDCVGCPVVVSVTGGDFVLGPDTNFGHEGTGSVHVKLRPFAFGARLVTQFQWQLCVDEHACGLFENGRVPPDDRLVTESFCPDLALREAVLDGPKKTVPEVEKKKALEECAVANATLRKETARWQRSPAIVSYAQALQYVAWLSHKTTKSYRLPSVAEWKRATRMAMLGWSEEVNWVADCWNQTYEGFSSKGDARKMGDCAEPVIRRVTLNASGRLEFRDRAKGPQDQVSAGFRVARSLE